MTANDENNAFRDSLSNFASYPRNLVHHNTFDHVLEAHVDRLDKQDERLFSDEEKTDVELWESGVGPSVFLSFRFNSNSQLWKHFLGVQLFAKVDPQCRFMFVHADHSRAKLKVTRYMLVTAFTYHQVMARFVDFLFSFGRQDYPKDFHFSGLYHETHLSDDQPSLSLSDLGRSGIDFKMCYNLKSVESSSSQPQFPWSVRQLAVYHSFDVVTGKSFWTMIKGDALIKRRIKAATEPSSHPNLDLSTALHSFLVTLTVQLIIFDWCREQWRWYISYLEELQEITTRRALTMSFDRPALPPSNNPPLRATTAPAGKVKRAFTQIIKRAASATGTLSPPIPLQSIPQTAPLRPEFEPDLSNTKSFSFSDLQKVQSYEEKVRELLLVVGSNIKIVTAIKDYYMELVESSGFPDEVKLGSARKTQDFKKAVLSIVNDLEMQHSRASMLLSTLTNRKGLLNGVLEYRSMEASKRFAEKAEASTREIHSMTEEMNALTQKTKQETVSMRIITLVTLFFLPGTFISVCLFSLTYFCPLPSPFIPDSVLAKAKQQTIMSTDILQYSKIPNTKDYEEDYSSAALKRYVSVTLPLMALTFLAWWVLYWWVDRKQHVKALKDQIKKMNKGGLANFV